jgi:tripartite-type tricarboxylate transporter receptor subunit TctC
LGLHNVQEEQWDDPMRKTKLRAGIFVAGLLAILAVSVIPARAQTSAQNWPQRPVKFIVPFGPGAGADIGARLLAERLPARWGKPLVIENRPGGDGLVAIQAFLSANDDHTLLFSPSGNFTVHPYQYDKLPYTPADLVPIARVSNTILAVGVPESMKVGTMAEWVTRARAEPGKFNAAVVPGITEFTFDYFVKTAGLTLQKVPYRDIVQAATDLGEGRLQVYMSSYAILQPQTEALRIRPLVVNGRERAPMLPNVPTAREAGFPSLEVEGLVGLFGPKGMASALREKIADGVVAATGDPAVSARLSATAQAVNPGGPAELAASIEGQRAQIAKIAQELGIKPKQ